MAVAGSARIFLECREPLRQQRHDAAAFGVAQSDQPAISSMVRPQPRHKPVAGSSAQILVQGVSIAAIGLA